jgi:uroporphyrinogen III methyltransferase/synthase
MTVRSRELLAEADVVVVDHTRLGEVVARFARPGARFVDAGAGQLDVDPHRVSRAHTLLRVAHGMPAGGLVVRVMDGDPTLFTGLSEEAAALRGAGVPFDVVPGVSAVNAVPMYAGVPLVSSDTTSLQVVHVGDAQHDWSVAVDGHVTLVLLGPPERLVAALADVLAAGRPGPTPVAVVEHGTTTAQTTHLTTLGQAGRFLSRRTLHGPAMAIVGAPVGQREALAWFETKPLFGWRVLVPTTKDPCVDAVAGLAAYGAQATLLPTIAVEPPRTPHQMERAVKGLVTGRYEWIGFTSYNAVRAVREKFDLFGLDARAFAGLHIAAVGGATTEALRAWGLVPDLVASGEQTTQGLLADWPEYDPEVDPINRVFLPRADIATDTLAAGLVEMGWEVDDVTAYRTVRAAPPAAEIREAIKGGAFDAVMFTSSSTVRNLVGIAGKPHATTVVACIGPQTARTAQEHGLRVDVLSPEPSPESLVDALAAHGALLALAQAESGEPRRKPSQRRGGSGRRAR